MARLIQQPDSIRQDFYRRIRAKIQYEKNEYQQRINRDMPFLGGFMNEFTGFMFEMDRLWNHMKGATGEHLVLHAIARFLPHSWVIAQGAILEPYPNWFTQIDHVLIGPPGIFLVETKAWSGSYFVQGDKWKRKDGHCWVNCSSPTRQADYHRNMWLLWMQQHVSGDFYRKIIPLIHSVIVLTNIEWIKAKATPVPILTGTRCLINYLLSQKQIGLQASEIETIAHLTAFQPRYNQQVPRCPKCHALMIPRLAKKGHLQGNWFYGCPNYPACREIHSIQNIP